MVKNKIKKVIKILLCISIIFSIIVLGINTYVKASVDNKILTEKECKGIKNADCILVLGCAVWNGEEPSPMLKDRLDKAIELYNEDVAPKIIMSGDHGSEDYDEVNVMKKYAIDKGVPSEDIFMDHAGFSTYESVVRAKKVFQVEKLVIVSQKYHLYRALYLAEDLDLEAYAVPAEKKEYAGDILRECREILARDKDFFTAIIDPDSNFLGDVISLDGNGDVTNDK